MTNQIKIFFLAVLGAICVGVFTSYRTEDPWKSPFRLECSGDDMGITVPGTTNRTRETMPLVLFHQAIPKTGSQSFTMFTSGMAKDQLQIIYTKQFLKGHYKSPLYLCNAMTKQRRKVPGSRRSGILAYGHFHFQDCSQGFNWISMVRSPLSRYISFYKYMHDTLSKRFVNHLGKRNISSMSLEEFARNPPYIRPAQQYFCGRDPICSTNTPSVLQRAKWNIEQHYVVVGLTEDMNNVLPLLEAYMPNLFKGASNRSISYKNKSKKTKQTQNITESVLESLMPLLAGEMELYEYCKRRFYTQLGQFG